MWELVMRQWKRESEVEIVMVQLAETLMQQVKGDKPKEGKDAGQERGIIQRGVQESAQSEYLGQRSHWCSKSGSSTWRATWSGVR